MAQFFFNKTKRVFTRFTLAAVTLATSAANAEYRVFQLAITSAAGQTRTVLSNLDDQQYPTYHPLQKDEKISIQDTWMCYRRSDQSQDVDQRYCPNPRAGQKTAGF